MKRVLVILRERRFMKKPKTSKPIILMRNKNEDNIYYRVLYSEDHIKKHFERKYSSSYMAIPGEWSDNYWKYELRELEVYNLECFEGTFTENARKHYLEIANTKSSQHDKLSKNETILATEIVGVYAFNNPQATVNFGFGPHSNNNIYVQFEGEYIRDSVDDHGVQAKIIKILGEWNELEFIQKFNLTKPKH